MENSNAVDSAAGEKENFADAFYWATKIKESELKQRSSRQEWEAAPPFMRHTCGEYEQVLNARQKNFQQRLEDAVELRQNGNQLYKKGQIEDALLCYSKSIAVFLWFQRGKNKSVEDVPLVSSLKEFNQEEQLQIRSHLSASLLNCAQVCIKKQEHTHAIYACNKALDLNPENAKALFKRAMAFIQQDTSSGLEQAAKDLHTASSLDPENAEIKAKYQKVKRELSEQLRKDKKTYKGIFQQNEEFYQDKENEINESTGARLKQEEFQQLKKRASEMGVDLDNPETLEKLKSLVQAKKQNQGQGQKRSGIRERIQDFCKDWFTVKKVLMTFVFLFFAFRMYRTMGAIVGVVHSEVKHGYSQSSQSY